MIVPALARVNDFVELAKPRITFLVVLTAAVGYAVGPGHFDAAVFFALVLGTALLSGGASALNQYREADTDALMERTRTRPLPEGRLHPYDAVLADQGAHVFDGIHMLMGAGFPSAVNAEW